MARLGLVLSCYDKVDDTLAHLEIQSFNRRDVPIIIAYMGEADPPPEFHRHHLIRFESPGFASGTLVSLIHAIRAAPGLGIDYLEFRNADDWLFNHDLVHSWHTHLDESGKLAAGYNWFGCGTFNDITMNELFVSVPAFLATADEAEEYIAASDQRYNCEYKMAWWVRRTLSDLAAQFYRLPGREFDPGVGRLIQDYLPLFERKKEALPAGFWERLNDNNRFFNREWQMIGSHNNLSRLVYWTWIRDAVPYAAELERLPHFNRWLVAASSNRPWNSRRPNLSRLGRQDRRYYPIRTQLALPRWVGHGRYPTQSGREYRLRLYKKPPPVPAELAPVVLMDT
jgi:hypothetical protein